MILDVENVSTLNHKKCGPLNPNSVMLEWHPCSQSEIGVTSDEKIFVVTFQAGK